MIASRSQPRPTPVAPPQISHILKCRLIGCSGSYQYVGFGMEKSGLDATDIRILSAVQKHGQLSKSKLAEIVNLSQTPCWARLTRLKAAGYIRGYHADIALDKIGDHTQVVVTVSLTNHRKADFDRFEAHIRKMDEVVECVATGGGMDYVLKFVTLRLVDFQELMDDMLSAELGIDRYMTYIVTREVKKTLPNITPIAARSLRK